ncbi:probable calcium-binding protein CML44 [Magnolia sinica]|uniref:probable calcium-binding protein CML44 n=1 Tax=Magnolia sinica TaxID=86752 RepID=UPI0026592AFB|nr:probable calcium-binding protein CML44 [Magnolia sinica]
MYLYIHEHVLHPYPLLETMSALHSSDLHRIFLTLDHDGDGHVDVWELSWLLHKVGVSTGLDELESTIGRTSLNLQQFIFFYESISTRESCSNDNNDDETDLIEAFKVFDQNNDGFITSSELQNVLASLGLLEETSSDCTRMISEFDMNSDGQLDFNEFKNMMLLTIS